MIYFLKYLGLFVATCQIYPQKQLLHLLNGLLKCILKKNNYSCFMKYVFSNTRSGANALSTEAALQGYS